MDLYRLKELRNYVLRIIFMWSLFFQYWFICKSAFSTYYFGELVFGPSVFYVLLVS